MLDLTAILSSIKPLDQVALATAQKRLDNLAIPRGSLGRLMALGRQYAGIRRDPLPKVRAKRIFTFAADHGVVEEGVSNFPKQVTREMVFNFMRGGAGINVLASHAGTEVTIVDIGVDFDFPSIHGLLNRKIRRGTGNISRERAMTREEALKAIEVGFELACEAASAGVDIIGTGDMGIGNTTPSSAIIAVFSGLPVAQVTGRGTGISDEALQKKIHTIEQAIALHCPDPTDPIDVLAKIGGLEIAGICGLIIGAAWKNRAVVIDGFISSAAAVVACELNPLIRHYLFASHRSVEQGHRVMLERMELVPLLDLEMRLGEGTGAALGIWLVEAGVKVLTEMLTFDEAGVTPGNAALT